MPIKYKSQGLPKIPSEFRQVAEELLGPVDWQNEDSGFCQCPGFQALFQASVLVGSSKNRLWISGFETHPSP